MLKMYIKYLALALVLVLALEVSLPALEHHEEEELL